MQPLQVLRAYYRRLGRRWNDSTHFWCLTQLDSVISTIQKPINGIGTLCIGRSATPKHMQNWRAAIVIASWSLARRPVCEWRQMDVGSLLGGGEKPGRSWMI